MNKLAGFVLCVSVILLLGVEAMEQGKFKKCGEQSFCTRQRNVASRDQLYRVLQGSLRFDSNEARALGSLVDLKSASQDKENLNFEVTSYEKGIFRMRVRGEPSHEVQDVIVDTAKKVPFTLGSVSGGVYKISSGQSELAIKTNEFEIEFSVNGRPTILVNSKHLLSIENRLNKETQSSSGDQTSNESNNNNTGDRAIGVDVTFPGGAAIYGIPEHAIDFALQPTPDEPYRMYNLDVFQYEIDNPLGLYGTVPIVLAHNPITGTTSAFLWLNAAESFLDVLSTGASDGSTVHWMSESGTMDMLFFPGPTPRDVMDQLSYLTGRPFLPQLFSISYHQCRWNYKDEPDVRQVDENFDAHDIPYDVLWLDIEHTDGKQYFTWDSAKFPDPVQMQRDLAAKGRKMVTISDPHIKRQSGYFVHKEATDNGHYVKKSDGSDYEGWCWPGSSSWVDFLSPSVRDWYASLYTPEKYKGSTETLYTWIDMNEPSVFSGPEITMPKDNLHHGGVAHRDVHNMYGFYHGMATHAGHLKRNANDRPFILSRSFFAGSQRYVAIWTGDNMASWQHLAAAQPMLLTLGVSGIPFVGADVGGFFNDPDAELMTRWYQAAAFHPFFRNHAHIDTKRREPWLFGEPHVSYMRKAVVTRYSYLPYWYTQFWHTSQNGSPVMRPLWFEYPKDANVLTMQDQFLVGTDLLVKPVTSPGVTALNVYLPGSEPWYDIETGSTYDPSTSRQPSIPAPADHIPVLQRGGSIIPKKERVRRSTTQMTNDPYTLVVALDSKGSAQGLLYLDDGKTFNYRNGDFSVISFSYGSNILKSVPVRGDSAADRTAGGHHSVFGSVVDLVAAHRGKKYASPSKVEKVVIRGFKGPAPSKIVLRTEDSHSSPLDTKLQITLDYDFDDNLKILVIRKPNTLITDSWSLHIE